MILADTVAIFLSVVGVILATNALWLFARAIWGKQTSLAGEIFVASPIKSFFLGLPILAITIVIVGILGKAGKGPAELTTIIVLSLFFLSASVGVSGFAAKIGDRLKFAPPDSWKCPCFGGLVLELTFILPVLGWLVIFPVSTIIGCGASARAWWRLRKSRRKSSKAEGDVEASSMATSDQTESVQSSIINQ